MGIRVEFNPELALRNMAEFHNGSRQLEECIPEKLAEGKIYPFLNANSVIIGLTVRYP